MATSAVRKSLVYILISFAKALALLENRVFIFVVQAGLLSGLLFFTYQNRIAITKEYSGLKSNIQTYLWYRNLPGDYQEKQEEESRSIFARYLEAVRSRPPKKIKDLPQPNVSAKSYIVFDVTSSTTLGSKDPGLPYPPASTAKLATALASLKLYKVDEEVVVPQFCTQIEGTKAEFLQGQRFIVRDLLKALLINSSADASCVLSIGKSSYAEFVYLMNQISQEAGLTHTKFTNPVGLDDTDGGNLSSAEDLALLGSVAVKNNLIKETVQLREFELKDLDGKYVKKLTNTNKLLSEIPGTVGIKTGTTTGAGEVLIYEYIKDQTDLIIVVMGSSDRFTDTKNILTWALNSFIWE